MHTKRRTIITTGIAPALLNDYLLKPGFLVMPGLNFKVSFFQNGIHLRQSKNVILILLRFQPFVSRFRICQNSLESYLDKELR